VGEATEQDCRDFAADVRKEEPIWHVDDFRGDGFIKEAVLREPDRLVEIINRAAQDPFEPVRILAPRAGASACFDRGLISNALAICRGAMLAKPQDDWICNRLAWTLATCPDATVRNGEEAVDAATKACELTQWKNGGWIDTLAAAYAEAGDFQRAIEFEERALQTGTATEPERREMQKRLALYRKSQPYRDQPP